MPSTAAASVAMVVTIGLSALVVAARPTTVAAPEGAADTHLQVLSRLAGSLVDDEALAKLREKLAGGE